MNENKAIVEIATCALSRKELNNLPDDQLAFLGLMNYAANELNCLQRVYISAAQSLTGEAYLDVAIASQRYTLLQVWSAKLFELMKAI